MQIAEVAKRYGISVDTIRYYERIGLVPRHPAAQRHPRLRRVRLRLGGVHPLHARVRRADRGARRVRGAVPGRRAHRRRPP
ncbi:MAG: MerR family DNA-binding transcriptional regulator [Eggerthella lenta]